MRFGLLTQTYARQLSYSFSKKCHIYFGSLDMWKSTVEHCGALTNETIRKKEMPK